MSLKKYQQKRNFLKTLEPEGKKEKISGNDNFVIHDHYAFRAGHHHDLRLEMKGVLKSWAIPKLTPIEKGRKVLAILVEDHPKEYADFSGIIPEGQYGAGKVEIFDKGKYKIIKKEEKRIEFELSGEKVKGIYALVKFKNPNQWLLFRTK